MSLQAPLIEKRTAADIAKQVKDLLVQKYAPEWKEFDPETGEPDAVSAALIGVFARFCEIIIQRLNQAPEKNFLAFLDLLGASLQPPQPARAPLTFSLAAGSTIVAVVPARTQVASPPEEGEKAPVIFETERELTITPARLQALFSSEPAKDLHADLSSVLDAPASPGLAVFQGSLQNDHILYLGHSGLLGFSNITSFKLNFILESNLEVPDARKLKWEFWDGSAWQEKTPGTDGDGTQGLTQTGTVEFLNIPSVPAGTVNGMENRWLRCRLATPILPVTWLPSLTDISIDCAVGGEGLAAQSALANLVPVDLTTLFYPFGEKPRLGDTLYLAQNDAFSNAGADVSISVTLIDQTVAGSALLRWEFWNGERWKELSAHDTAMDPPTDATNFKTSGTIEFIVPANEKPQMLAVNGVEGYWIRARIVSGNYGEEAKYVADGSGGYQFLPATFAPPVIDKIEIKYSVSIASQLPEKIFTYNDFVYTDVTRKISFEPFRPSKDGMPTIYYAFVLPASVSSFPNSTVSLFNRISEYKYGDPGSAAGDIPAGAGEQPSVEWEYWNGEQWNSLSVVDDSENFTRPGIVEFLPPSDFASSEEFGRYAYWLRAVWKSGAYSVTPALSRVLLNTVMAAQTITVNNEIIGSSDQSEKQAFRTVRTPVLSGQQIEVREPEMPSTDEETLIKAEEGDDAISVVSDATGRPTEIWVRWHETPDFYGSGPRDRHYVIDHLSGLITFGNGANGMTPPRGSGNIRLRRYQTGGGATGNRPAGSISQLKTTVPSVINVYNSEAATGGADAETTQQLFERAPRTIRHRERSVTREDYEDLARLASPDVARAKCVAVRDLASDPLGLVQQPGDVSVIVVPRSNDAKAVPTLELINRVRDYLMDHCIPTANISVVGPLYVRVDVTAEIALTSIEGASAVNQAIGRKLSEFLHPLTGGLDGKGWDFGREPYKSDLYALIESVPGVDHIRYLKVNAVEEMPGAKDTHRFLVYSGNHEISLTFEEA